MAGAGLAAPGSMTAGWSEREMAVLTALAETFVAGDAERRATVAAEALAETADPEQVRLLRLVLRAMDSRALNVALAGHPTPFTAMTQGDRERYLLGWAGSRIPQRRGAFAAYRKLLTFLAYAPADASDGLAGQRLAAIGFRTDAPPVAAQRSPVRVMALPATTGGGGAADDPVTLDADAVVVGSGAGGGVIAATLARAGRAVVILEAGSFSDEAALPRAELEGFDRHYLNHGLTTTWDGAVTMLAGTGVGGGTLVNWTTCISAPEDVRAEWETDHGLDGMTGDAWSDEVAAIEAELGVAEATHIPPKDAILLRGARALGWEAAATRRNADGCGDCGSCGFGCPRGTKRSGIRVHLADATAAGARLVADARVTRIVLEGGRAAGVEAIVTGDHGSTPRHLVVRARTVVVAAGALRTPAVLLASGLDHPHIGRHLRLHPVPVVAGRFSELVEMWRGTLQAARSLEFSPPAPGRNGYVIESAPGHPGLLALALPWEGTAAHAEVMGRMDHLSPLIAVTRDGGDGRVRLTKSGGVRLDYDLDAGGIATMRHALVSMARLMRAAGAEETVAVGTPPAWFRAGASPAADADGRRFAAFEASLAAFDFSPNRGGVFSAHQMGSARMGADPRTHPVDLAGRVRVSDRHDRPVPGLYVGDGSLFPTGIGVNPMITVMALARRVARAILAEA
ncbi:MAG: GMC family oxidoreductase N-terminal domain-containing protein [Chloroflexota bacterium]